MSSWTGGKPSLRNHPNIAAASAAVRVNESRIGQAKSNDYPQINRQTNYSKSSPLASASTWFSSNMFDQYSSNLSLTQNISVRLLFNFAREMGS